MKLKNKQTGIFGELHFDPDKEYHFTAVTEDPADVMIYKKLADLYADWEDALEKPKEYWYIDSYTYGIDFLDEGANEVRDNFNKEIGNYFETEEEAELAVRKLKAWKRLKDNGFRFTLTPATGSLDTTPDKFQIEITAEMPAEWFCCDAVQEDLEACFGGEE